MITKRNLAPALLQWLMSTLQIGPGIGDVHYLVATSGDAYHLWLLANKIETSKIHTTLAAGENALTAARNDVLLVFPGDHTLTAGVTWDKSQTHMVGLGGPNMRVQPSTLTTGGLRFKTVTTGVSYLLDIQGNYCQFHNIGTFNNGAATTNLGDIGIVGKNCYFKRCDFRGGNNTAQNQATTPFAGVPIIFESGSGYGNGTTFEECQIGSAGNTTRTNGPGAVLFMGGAASAGFDVQFRKCVLEMWCETTGSAAASLVWLKNATQSCDRYMLFDECLFYNFWTNLQGKVDYAIVDAQTTTHNIVIKRSTAVGIDYWSNVATYCFADMPDVAASGGVVEAITTA